MGKTLRKYDGKKSKKFNKITSTVKSGNGARWISKSNNGHNVDMFEIKGARFKNNNSNYEYDNWE